MGTDWEIGFGKRRGIAEGNISLLPEVGDNGTVRIVAVGTIQSNGIPFRGILIGSGVGCGSRVGYCIDRNHHRITPRRIVIIGHREGQDMGTDWEIGFGKRHCIAEGGIPLLPEIGDDGAIRIIAAGAI